MGPLLLIAPLFFVIEIIGTVRPDPVAVAAALHEHLRRAHDHGVFASLVPIIVPWPMMALGIFTAFLQAYVFALLSAVYVGGAVAHEEH